MSKGFLTLPLLFPFLSGPPKSGLILPQAPCSSPVAVQSPDCQRCRLAVVFLFFKIQVFVVAPFSFGLDVLLAYLLFGFT